MSSETIYHLLGKISITFASFEHGLVDLLEYLLTKGKDTLVGPYILKDIPLWRKIKETRSVAELRLWEHKSTFSELKKVLDDFDKLRGRRNLFIHGYWYIREPSDNADSVTVHDFKPMLDKKSGLWQELKTERVSRTTLKKLLQKTTAALENLTSIDADIRKLKLR